MLISGVLPIISLYRLPHGQYAYSGHIINLSQDVASFVNSLPRLPTELDIIDVRKQGAADSHHDFRVKRSAMLAALQWLLVNNQYYRSIQINSPCSTTSYEAVQARPMMPCIYLVSCMGIARTCISRDIRVCVTGVKGHIERARMIVCRK